MRAGQMTLKTVPQFRELPPDLLSRIDEISDIQEIEHDQRICTQGETPLHLHFVLSGQVVLTSTAPDGSTAVVEVIHPVGDFVLGSVIGELPYLQTAQTVTRSRLLMLEAASLRRLIAQEPALSWALLNSMSRDYRNLIRQIRDLKVRTAAQRLGCYLLARVPDPSAATAEIRLPFEKGLLAARLGCRQENLSRAFAALRELGVETRGARVVLHDIPRLTAYAMPDYLDDPELAREPQPIIAKAS